MTHSRPTTETPAPDSADRASSADAPLDAIAAAVGKIPSGLFVVTWRDAGHDRTMLASWVMQAGFDPPAITIAVAPTRDLLSAIEQRSTFAVNVLGDGQRPLLARFGRPIAAGEDPFAGLEITRSPSGNALLGESSGWLECRAMGRLGADAADHVVVVAEVVGGGPGRVEPPLVHVRKNGLRY